jgi:hypothetical protein
VPPWYQQATPNAWLQLGGTQATANTEVSVNSSSNNAFDSTLHLKVAGAVILALALVFAIPAAGFRFVTSATVGLGK